MNLSFTDVEAAAARISPYVHRTPLLTSRTLGFAMKAENTQKGGAFKVRGALNKLLSLDPGVRARGVVAFSSGNHAQGVAIAAALCDVPAVIVMPEDSVAHKVAATKAYGAEVVQEGVDVHSRDAVARGIAEARGMTLVPPFDDPFVIAGQGTVGLELLAQDPDLELVLVPLGGGGLLAGVALAVKTLKPSIRVVGVEPSAGDDGVRSFRSGRRIPLEAPPRTIADGARTLCVGERNFEIIRRFVDDIVTVDDDALLEAVWLLASRAKTVVEPTGALGAAALLGGRVGGGGRAAVVLSGGNIGPEMLARAAATAV
jgi:threonine dehydratase